MENVLPHLWVGGDLDYQKVKDREGWSFLRTCKDGPGAHRETLGYHTLGAPKGPNYLWVRRGNRMALNILDLDDPSRISDDMVRHGIDFVKERVEAGDKILIACNAGHSRGPTTALLYMRSIGEMPHNFITSERIFRTLYPPYDPGTGMRQFARSHWYEYGRTQ